MLFSQMRLRKRGPSLSFLLFWTQLKTSPFRWCHQHILLYDVTPAGLIDFPYSHTHAVKSSKNKSPH